MLLISQEENTKIVRLSTKDMGLIEWAILYTLRERPDLHTDIADGLDQLLIQINKVNQLKPA